jgi:hypothetical protein
MIIRIVIIVNRSISVMGVACGGECIKVNNLLRGPLHNNAKVLHDSHHIPILLSAKKVMHPNAN